MVLPAAAVVEYRYLVVQPLSNGRLRVVRWENTVHGRKMSPGELLLEGKGYAEVQHHSVCQCDHTIMSAEAGSCTSTYVQYITGQAACRVVAHIGGGESSDSIDAPPPLPPSSPH